MPYGPLEGEQACKVLRTLSEKIFTALEELHNFGYGHGDVRLPNVCFNSEYDAVLIDMERCERNMTEESTLCAKLDRESCMYKRPETLEGTLTPSKQTQNQMARTFLIRLDSHLSIHQSFFGVKLYFTELFDAYKVALIIGLYNAVGKNFIVSVGRYAKLCLGARATSPFLCLQHTSTSSPQPGALYVNWKLPAKELRSNKAADRVVMRLKRTRMLR